MSKASNWRSSAASRSTTRADRRGRACLTNGLRATLQRRGLEPVRFHAIRHSVASAMLAAGASMLEVQAQLGHSDAVTTLGIYGHLLPGALSAAAGRYGQAWEKANEKPVESGGHQSDTDQGSNVVPFEPRVAR